MENKNKHTPGPWKIFYPEAKDCGLGVDTEDKENPKSIVVMDTESGIIADSEEEQLANAKLIASAPELLESLTQVSQYLFNTVDPSNTEEHLVDSMPYPLVKRMQDAIKKATT
jgi:hypothetical protein